MLAGLLLSEKRQQLELGSVVEVETGVVRPPSSSSVPVSPLSAKALPFSNEYVS